LKKIVLKEKQLAELGAHIDEFAPIMGATIIAETLSHEIIRLSNNINSSSSKVRNAVLKDNREEAILNLNRLDSSNKFLVRYASLLDVNSYSRRRRYSVESIKEKLEEILKNLWRHFGGVFKTLHFLISQVYLSACPRSHPLNVHRYPASS